MRGEIRRRAGHWTRRASADIKKKGFISCLVAHLVVSQSKNTHPVSLGSLDWSGHAITEPIILQKVLPPTFGPLSRARKLPCSGLTQRRVSALGGENWACRFTEDCTALTISARKAHRVRSNYGNQDSMDQITFLLLRLPPPPLFPQKIKRSSPQVQSVEAVER